MQYDSFQPGWDNWEFPKLLWDSRWIQKSLLRIRVHIPQPDLDIQVMLGGGTVEFLLRELSKRTSGRVE